MTTHDDNPWAPRERPAAPANGAGEPSVPTPATRPTMPSPSSAPTPPPAHAPSSLGPPPAAPSAPVDRVVVGPVEAETSGARAAAGRIVAGAAAAILIGGGAFLAFGAATASGGADTPEAALEQAIAAINDEDMVALAEVMEPSERETLFEVGFDFVDELARLEVLADDIDMSAIGGIDLTLTGFRPQVERPGNGLAHLYVGTGTVAGEIDVAAMPLGPLILDRLDDEQRTWTDSAIETSNPATTPLVAVERDGRWYLSFWYTAAENARLEAGAPLPDLLDRPAAIGGPTPDAAVRLLFEEAVQLDVRRMIGALDPEEMAVLYDYAPLFLDDAEPAINSFLEEARATGWTWGFDELSFTTTELGDGLARVSLASFAFSAADEAGSRVALAVGEESFALEVITVDEFFGDRFEMSVATDGDCVVVDMTDSNGPQNERICSDELAERTGVQGLDPTSTLDGLDQIGIVTRQVDGVWYISPIRTGSDLLITAIEQLEPETLAEIVDNGLGLGGLALGGAYSLPGMELGGVGFGDSDPFIESIDPPDPIDVTSFVENEDLLAVGLDPTFAYDMDPEAAQHELDFWAPEIGEVAINRGVYATVSSPSLGGGDVAVLTLELENLDAAEIITRYADAVGAVVDTTTRGDVVVESVDPFGDPIIVQGRGPRLHVFGVYGASADDLETVAAIQTSGT